MWEQNKQNQQRTYDMPITSLPNCPTVPHVEEGWRKRNYKNKPQSNSVGTASLIFISGGMSMTWNLGFSIDNNADLHTVLSWFIGCIIGAVVGGIICNIIHKRLITCFACFLVTLSGILQVSDPHTYDSFIASRYTNGIAVGLVFPLTFVLVGEEVIKSMRGMNAAAVDTMSFGCGIFIQTIYSYMWTSEFEESFSVTQMNGILNILWGLIGFIMAITLLKESPIFYLARGQEEMATDVLRQLQRPSTITCETYEQLEEHKRYLAESKDKSFLQSAVMGLPALAKLCFYRSFMALSFSFFVNYAFSYSCIATSRLDIWPFYLYGMARWLGAMIFMFSLDCKGRKPSMTTGFFVCCISAFAIGGIFDDKRNFIDYNYMNAVKFLLIIYQFSASAAMASSSVYLSEAFPLAVKPYYISIVFIAEMLVHIIILCSKSNVPIFNLFDMNDYFYTIGSLSLLFFIVAIFLMPETKGNTLRECLQKFRKLINFK